MIRKACGWIAVVFVAAMLWVLWPNSEVRNQISWREVYVQPGQEIPLAQARKEAQAILEEAKRMQASGVYSAAAHMEHRKQLLRLVKFSRFHGRYGADGLATPIGFVKNQTFQIFAFADDKDRSKLPDMQALMSADPEYIRLDRLRTEEEFWSWSPLWKHLAQTYPLTIALALLYHLCILTVRRRSLLGELLVPDRLIKASVLWPVQFWYETRSPREQFSRAIYALAYGLVGILCFTPASAKGQSGKDGGKQRTPSTLQLDLRNSWYLSEGPPSFNLFGRATLNSGRFVLESISTRNTKLGTWHSEFGIGYGVMRKPTLSMNAISMISQNNKHEQQLMLGAQLFWRGKRGVLAIPVARLEYTPETKIRSVALGINASIPLASSGTLARLAVTPDVTIRKTSGQKTTWFAGSGLRYHIGKRKNAVETAVLRDWRGFWQVRGRAILNFAF